jgi:hypothetical protein
LQSGIIAGPHKQHRLRPIDAGYLNELPAISRDPNVIDGSCNALMRSPQAWSLEGSSPGRSSFCPSARTSPAIPVKRDSQVIPALGRRAATNAKVGEHLHRLLNRP